MKTDHIQVRATDVKRINRFLSGQSRVLLITGPSGSGKSTLLGHIYATDDLALKRRIRLDSDELLGGILRPGQDPDDAALLLLRRLGTALVHAAPWWRRRSALRHARSIGHVDRLGTSHIRQQAIFGGKIQASPVTVHSPLTNRMERRVSWVEDLLKVTQAVGRRPYLLLLDTCERLQYLDDLGAEALDQRGAINVTGWFAEVLDELLTATPGGRIILAGSSRIGTRKRSYDHHELRPWNQREMRNYLTGRGIGQRIARALAEEMSGLPIELSWVAEAMTELAVETRLASPTNDWFTNRPSTEPWKHWLSDQVLAHLTDDQHVVIEAASVLRAFTPQTVEAMVDRRLPRDWFARFSKRSFVEQLSESQYYRINPNVRGWNLASLEREDTHRPPDVKILPRLHAKAADYYSGIHEDGFSLDEAYHRFALGDDSLSDAWRALVDEARNAVRYDTVAVLTEIVLAPEIREPVRTKLPSVFAHAASLQASLADSLGDNNAAMFWYRQAAVAHKGIGNKRGEADSLLFSGRANLSQGRYQESKQDLTECLRIFRQTADHQGCADATFHLGRCAFATSQFGEATRLLRQSVKAFERVDDKIGQANALNELGTNLLRQGDLLAAKDAHDKSLLLIDETGDRQQRAAALLGLGRVARGRGQNEQAEALARQALEGFVAVNDRGGEAEALTQIGRVQYGNGQLKLAEMTFRIAISIDKERGDSRSQIDTMLVLGQLLIDQRKFELAVTGLAEIRSLVGGFGDDPRTQAAILHYAGRLALVRGRASEAKVELEEALTAAKKLGDRPLQAYALFDLALAVRDEGDLARAEDLVRQVLKMVRVARDARTEGFALQELAELLLARRAPDARRAVERAIEHYGALRNDAVVAALRQRLMSAQ